MQFKILAGFACTCSSVCRSLKWSRHLVGSEAGSSSDSIAKIKICLTSGWSSYFAVRIIRFVDIHNSSYIAGLTEVTERFYGYRTILSSRKQKLQTQTYSLILSTAPLVQSQIFRFSFSQTEV
jgi:hypothetical protein